MEPVNLKTSNKFRPIVQFRHEGLSWHIDIPQQLRRERSIWLWKFLVYPRGSWSWSQAKRKDTLQFYGEHEKKIEKNKNWKAPSSPEWYEVAKQLRHKCSRQDVPIEKNPKQSKAKFSFS